jgi:hypothetical protein
MNDYSELYDMIPNWMSQTPVTPSILPLKKGRSLRAKSIVCRRQTLNSIPEKLEEIKSEVVGPECCWFTCLTKQMREMIYGTYYAADFGEVPSFIKKMGSISGVMMQDAWYKLGLIAIPENKWSMYKNHRVSTSHVAVDRLRPVGHMSCADGTEHEDDQYRVAKGEVCVQKHSSLNSSTIYNYRINLTLQSKRRIGALCIINVGKTTHDLIINDCSSKVSLYSGCCLTFTNLARVTCKVKTSNSDISGLKFIALPAPQSFFKLRAQEPFHDCENMPLVDGISEKLNSLPTNLTSYKTSVKSPVPRNDLRQFDILSLLVSNGKSIFSTRNIQNISKLYGGTRDKEFHLLDKTHIGFKSGPYFYTYSKQLTCLIRTDWSELSMMNLIMVETEKNFTLHFPEVIWFSMDSNFFTSSMCVVNADINQKQTQTSDYDVRPMICTYENFEEECDEFAKDGWVAYSNMKDSKPREDLWGESSNLYKSLVIPCNYDNFDVRVIYTFKRKIPFAETCSPCGLGFLIKDNNNNPMTFCDKHALNNVDWLAEFESSSITEIIVAHDKTNTQMKESMSTSQNLNLLDESDQNQT